MAAAQALIEQQMAEVSGAGAGNGREGTARNATRGAFDPNQGGLPRAVAEPEGSTFEGTKGRPRGSEQPISAVPEQSL